MSNKEKMSQESVVQMIIKKSFAHMRKKLMCKIKKVMSGDEMDKDRQEKEKVSRSFRDVQDDRSEQRVSPKLYCDDEPGPSATHEDEEQLDFCPSDSSWHPSNEEQVTSDDEYEEKKKAVKLERYSRSYSRKNTTTRKVKKPSNKVTPVIVTHNTRKINQKPAEPKMGFNHVKLCNITPPNLSLNKNVLNNEEEPVQISPSDINRFKRLFLDVMEISHESQDDSKENSRDSNSNNELEESFKGSSPRTESDFDRSDDNILITNKHATINEQSCDVDPSDEISYYIVMADENKEDLSLSCNTNNNKVYVKNKDGSNNARNNMVNVNNENKENLNIMANGNNMDLTPAPAINENKIYQKYQDDWIPIGSGMTLIHKDKYSKVKWKSYSVATRTLLTALFSRRTLATHSLTGKRSPAFKDKQPKMSLDPKIVEDIILEVMTRFRVRRNQVRTIMTTKCADECKMLKQRQQKLLEQKQNSKEQDNVENAP